MKIGSLFTGYGGLDLAVEQHVNGSLEWYAEIEPAACKILEELHPGVPNLGDVTKIDWSTVPPVDVITGGYPCQPFSHAGNRKGKNDERHLWPYVRDAIRTIRPRFAVLENVRGHVSLGFADVLADLASIGFDAEWSVVRASDAGACHQRARLFIITHPNTQGVQGHEDIGGEAPSERRGHFEQGAGSLASDTEHNGLTTSQRGGSIRTSPSQGRGQEPQGNKRESAGSGSTRFAPDTDSDGHGQQLHSRRMGSLETETESQPQQRERSRGKSDTGSHWGKYAPAIARWEDVTGRQSPEPTIVVGTKQKLNPVFVEWMMGLNEGHVTGNGLTHAQELKMLGNGVVPQQASLALKLLGV